MVGWLPDGMLVTLSVELRVDNEWHPVAGDDVVNVRSARGELGKPRPGRDEDALEEVGILEILRLACAGRDRQAEQVSRRNASPGCVVLGDIARVRLTIAILVRPARVEQDQDLGRSNPVGRDARLRVARDSAQEPDGKRQWQCEPSHTYPVVAHPESMLIGLADRTVRRMSPRRSGVLIRGPATAPARCARAR